MKPRLFMQDGQWCVCVSWEGKIYTVSFATFNEAADSASLAFAGEFIPAQPRPCPPPLEKMSTAAAA